MATNYQVIHTVSNSAKILRDRREEATLENLSRDLFILRETTGNRRWTLSHKVDGDIRPFSLACYLDEKLEESHEDKKSELGQLILRIKDHLFYHSNNFYSIGGAMPDPIPAGDYTTGSKYIIRLVNFPYTDIDEIDEETKHQITRHRGVAVAEFKGLGADGFDVKFYNDELNDIALQLTASTYLLYTTR